jgi:hypothetical protein
VVRMYIRRVMHEGDRKGRTSVEGRIRNVPIRTLKF